MRLEDFSNGFDTLLNSYSRRDGFGTSDADIRLDEYEKSLFLTEAQETYVISLYNGRNSSGESFEQTEELRRYLAPLIKEAELAPIETTTGILGIDSRSKFFTLPEDLWFITYESVLITDGKCEGSTTLDVYPVRQDEYSKLKKNPFRGANDRRALRLDLADNVIEIVSSKGVTSYYVRYLKKLKPIVLADFGNDIAIEGVSTATECELPDSLHQRILEIAVGLALQSKGISKNRE